MKYTCVNCQSYHGRIEDPETGFHIHDYCSLFKAQIPSTVIFDRMGYVEGFDDIECGIAVCWGFSPKDGNLVEKFPKMTNNKKEYCDESDNCRRS